MDPYKFHDWYYTEEVLLNIFFELLPWIITERNGMSILLLYIRGGYCLLNKNRETVIDTRDQPYFCNINISFLNNIKFQLSKKLLGDMC